MGERQSLPAVFRFLSEDEVCPERFSRWHPFASGSQVTREELFDFQAGSFVIRYRTLIINCQLFETHG